MRACLDRIAAREPVVQAFASVDPDLALACAQALDRGPIRGPLHGVPIGVKDVIDTFDLPTQMGSEIYADHQAAQDAACVALVRAAGAVILGKTVTAEFAGMTPGPTTNPHNAARTPGGSSSGSGAAVADRMLAAAFGTQTGGSILRPSAYCGVIGYKPTFNLINRAGLKFAAESLDTIGLIARSDRRSCADHRRARSAANRRRRSRPTTPPRIGLCRTSLWATARPETQAAVEDAARRLSAAGAPLREVVLPDELRRPQSGGARDHQQLRTLEGDGGRIRQRSRTYQRAAARARSRPAAPCRYADYVAALRLGEDCRARLDGVFDGLDMMLAPCVDGEAPLGLAHTGDPGFQAIWTILHVPTLTLPTHRGPNGMPVGIQLIAPRRRDQELFAAAKWVWERLGPPTG